MSSIMAVSQKNTSLQQSIQKMTPRLSCMLSAPWWVVPCVTPHEACYQDVHLCLCDRRGAHVYFI